MAREWEKLAGESAKAYQAFTRYRDMGPARSTAKVARELGKSKALMDRWSSRHEWVDRAAALDARDDQIRLEAVEVHKLREAVDIAMRVEDLREANLANEERAAVILAKYLDYAERLIDELPLVREVVVREGDDGKPAIYQIEPATKDAVLDATRLHKIATRSQPARLDFRTYDLSMLTDEQLERIANGEDPRRVLGD